MAEAWVLDASPFIALAKTGLLDLLPKLAPDVLLPAPVIDEILAGPAGDPARLAIQGGWGRPVAIETVPPAILEWGLGPGESSVLALSLGHRGHVAILDDAQARMCARSLKIPVLGTLGIVILARRAGLIETASSVVRRLQDAGLYLDAPTVKSALERLVGEKPEN